MAIHAAATSLILYSTIVGAFASTMNRPEPTYTLSSMGRRKASSVSNLTCTTEEAG